METREESEMVVGILLSLATIVAVVAYVLRIKGFSTFGPYHVWRALTAPIRGVHWVLPPILVFPAWLVALWIADVFGSLWLTFALFFVFPVALGYEFIRVGIPATIGVTLGVVGVVTSDVKPDRENFALPLLVHESEAGDVSDWVDEAMHVPRRSLLTLGASGAGKSEALKHFVDQLRSNPEEPIIVFDMKTDYQEFLEERGASMIRLSSEGSRTEIGSPVAWNVFEEMEREDDADEIARALFPDRNGEDNFFATAGRQLFAANLKYLFRELENPTNADLVDYWERADAETMYENLTRDGHEDLTAAASAVDPDAGRQSSGVFATAQQTVSDLFVGDFAGEGTFSIREYMQNPQGRILVLDYPTRQASTIAPVFRYLIDEAIKHGMADANRSAYYLLDEIEHMDVAISRLGELINVGRGNQCQAILSLQSVAQLQDTYGRERANALLSGMTTSIILRTADEPSVDYARETIGTEFHEYTGHVEREQSLLGGGMIETGREMKTEEEHVFARGDIRSFEAGEAVICRQGKGWVHGRLMLLSESQSRGEGSD